MMEIIFDSEFDRKTGASQIHVLFLVIEYVLPTTYGLYF